MFETVFPGAGQVGLILMPLLFLRGPIERAAAAAGGHTYEEFLAAFVADVRYRALWIEVEDELVTFALYTRLGGPNRADRAGAVHMLDTHPWFRESADDQFDPTYATWRFTVPAEIAVKLVTELRVIQASPAYEGLVPLLYEGRRDTDAMWAAVIESLHDGPLTPEAQELGRRIDEAIKDA